LKETVTAGAEGMGRMRCHVGEASYSEGMSESGELDDVTAIAAARTTNDWASTNKV
jgi:hypothetical protein